MARVGSITELEHIAARHWRGTEEDRLGGWLLRAADGFTGRANSALPLGDPGMPLDDALAAVTRWYRARALPPMIVIPVPLEGDSPCHQLDNLLSERTWLTRPGPAFVMVADLATVPPPATCRRAESSASTPSRTACGSLVYYAKETAAAGHAHRADVRSRASVREHSRRRR